MRAAHDGFADGMRCDDRLVRHLMGTEADRQAATSPEVKAALDAVYAKADPLIDAWARFVALTRARNVAAETREQVLGSLKTVYGTRYVGDTTGLEPLITKLQAEYTPK